MSFEDRSASYTHSWATYSQWVSGTAAYLPDGSGVVRWEPIHYRFGYGIFKIWIERGHSVIRQRPYLGLDGILLFLPKVLPLLKERRVELFPVSQSKFEACLDFIMTLVGEPAPEKIMQHLRSQRYKIVLGNRVLSASWELMDESINEVLQYLILYSSLQKQENAEAMRLIGQAIRNGGQLLGESAAAWLLRSFDAVAALLPTLPWKPKKLLPLLRQSMKTDAPENTVHLWSGFFERGGPLIEYDELEYEALRRHVFLPGMHQRAKAEVFKYIAAPTDHNHSAVKLQEMLRGFDRGAIGLFGVEPGGMHAMLVEHQRRGVAFACHGPAPGFKAPDVDPKRYNVSFPVVHVAAIEPRDPQVRKYCERMEEDRLWSREPVYRPLLTQYIFDCSHCADPNCIIEVGLWMSCREIISTYLPGRFLLKTLEINWSVLKTWLEPLRPLYKLEFRRSKNCSPLSGETYLFGELTFPSPTRGRTFWGYVYDKLELSFKSIHSRLQENWRAAVAWDVDQRALAPAVVPVAAPAAAAAAPAAAPPPGPPGGGGGPPPPPPGGPAPPGAPAPPAVGPAPPAAAPPGPAPGAPPAGPPPPASDDEDEDDGAGVGGLAPGYNSEEDEARSASEADASSEGGEEPEEEGAPEVIDQQIITTLKADPAEENYVAHWEPFLKQNIKSICDGTGVKTSSLHPVNILADGFCLFRSCAVLRGRCQSSYEAEISRFCEVLHLDTDRKRFMTGEKRPTKEQISAYAEYEHFPLLFFTRGEAEPRVGSSVDHDAAVEHGVYGILLAMDDQFQGHVDAACFKNHPVIRKPKQVELSKLVWHKMKLCAPKQLLEKYKTSRQLILDCLLNNVDPDINEAHKPIAALLKKMNATRCELEFAILNMCPGAGKSYGAAKWMKRHEWAYITGLRANRDEVAKLVQAFNGISEATQERDYLIKTLYKAIEFLGPQSQVKYLVVDECFRYIIDLIFIYAQVYPNAKFIFLGDPNQMTINKEWFPTATVCEGLKEYLERNGLDLNSTKTVTVSDVSRRFGPGAVLLVRRLHPKTLKGKPYSLFCADARVTKVVKVAYDERPPVLLGHAMVVEKKTRDCLDSSVADRTLTVCASQGVSTPLVTLFLTNDSSRNLNRYRDSLLVALTRMSKCLVLVELEPGAVAALVPNGMITFGGKLEWFAKHDLRRFEPFGLYHEVIREAASRYPVNERATLFKTEKLVHYQPQAQLSFSHAELAYWAVENQLALNNQVESMAFWCEELPKSMKVYSHRLNEPIRREAKLMTTCTAGKRHLTNSHIQALNTFTDRLRKGEEARDHQREKAARSRLFPTKVEKLAEKWWKMYIDPEKFEVLMSSELHLDEFYSQAWNEFCSVAKMDSAQAGQTLRGFTFALRGHLKQQVKAKGLEAAYNNKGGQPIAAAEKAVNLCFSLLFRVMTKILRSSFRDNFLWADGSTDREVHEWFVRHPSINNFLGDYPNFDATQSDLTQLITAVVWRTVCHDRETFETYREITMDGSRPLVTGELMAPAGTEKKSGRPDTMADNIMTSTVAIASMFRVEDVKAGCFKGDDSVVKTDLTKLDLDMEFYDLVWKAPMKVQFLCGVAEFCNFIFDDEHYCMNPLILTEKIMNKDYSSVVRTREDWDEWKSAVATMVNPFRENPYGAATVTAKYLGIPREAAHCMWLAIDSYAQLNYAQIAELQLDSVPLEDVVTYGGGHLQMNPNTKTANYNDVPNAETSNAKNSLQEWAIRKGMQPRYDTKVMGGPPHLPLFSCVCTVANYGTRVVNAPSKVAAEKAAAVLLLSLVREDQEVTVLAEHVRAAISYLNTLLGMVETEDPDGYAQALQATRNALQHALVGNACEVPNREVGGSMEEWLKEWKCRTEMAYETFCAHLSDAAAQASPDDMLRVIAVSTVLLSEITDERDFQADHELFNSVDEGLFNRLAELRVAYEHFHAIFWETPAGADAAMARARNKFMHSTHGNGRVTWEELQAELKDRAVETIDLGTVFTTADIPLRVGTFVFRGPWAKAKVTPGGSAWRLSGGVKSSSESKRYVGTTHLAPVQLKAWFADSAVATIFGMEVVVVAVYDKIENGPSFRDVEAVIREACKKVAEETLTDDEADSTESDSSADEVGEVTVPESLLEAPPAPKPSAFTRRPIVRAVNPLSPVGKAKLKGDIMAVAQSRIPKALDARSKGHALFGMEVRDMPMARKGLTLPGQQRNTATLGEDSKDLAAVNVWYLMAQGRTALVPLDMLIDLGVTVYSGPQERVAIVYATCERCGVRLICNQGAEESAALAHNKAMHASQGNRTGKQKEAEKSRVKQIAKAAATKAVKRQHNRKPKKSKAMKPARKAIKAQVHSKSMSRLAREILMCICNPYENPVPRFADIYSDSATAVAKPFWKIPVPWLGSSTDPGTAKYVPLTDSPIWLFRDPLRSVVLYDVNKSGSAYAYSMYFCSGSATNALSPGGASLLLSDTFEPYVDAYLPIAYAAPTSTYTPHGPIWYPGVLPEHSGKWFWLDVGSVVSITGVCDITDTGIFNLDYWGGATVDLDRLTIAASWVAATPASFSSASVTAAGYYSINYRPSNTQNLSITGAAITKANGATCGHLSLKGLENNVMGIDGIRVLSYSIRYVNTAAQLQLGGSITAVQLPQGRNWFDNLKLDGAGYDMIASSNGAYDDKIKDGLYGFAKPTQADDFNFRTRFETSATGLRDSSYPLKNESAFLAVYPRVDVGVGQSGTWYIAAAAEYQTTDQWRDYMIPPADAGSFGEAMIHSKDIVQWHENPVHLKEIWDNIKRAIGIGAGAVTKYGPTAIKVAGMLA